MHDGAHPFNKSRGINMKQTRLTKILAVGALCTAALGTALAQRGMQQVPQQGSSVQQLPQRQQQQQQTTSSTTGTATMATATGTIATYTSGSDHFMFRPSPDAAPVRYYHTKDTVIVDAEGHAVDQSALRPGTGATMYYTTSGDRMIVRKIVVGESTAPEKKGAKTATKPKP
jgi:hypothetical protein